MRRICRITILVIEALFFVVLLGSTGCGASSETLKSTRDIEHQREVEDIQLLSGQMTYPFEPSLEMKENVDFLLTPAILVQEALSGHVVLTYPTD